MRTTSNVTDSIDAAGLLTGDDLLDAEMLYGIAFGQKCWHLIYVTAR